MNALVHHNPPEQYFVQDIFQFNSRILPNLLCLTIKLIINFQENCELGAFALWISRSMLHLSPNLINLSSVSNPQKTGFN